MILLLIFFCWLYFSDSKKEEEKSLSKGERVFNDNTEWHKAQAMLRWKNGTLLSEADREIAEEGFKDLESVEPPHWMKYQKIIKQKQHLQ